MDIPFSRWYPLIPVRRSRRQFDPRRPVAAEPLDALDRVCRNFRPFPHARVVLVNNPSQDVFKGMVGGYGKVTGAPAFIAFIGDMRAPSVQEEVGYTGEGLILEAAALGLDTCWVGGFFRPESVAALIEVKDYERVLSVTPLGYAAGQVSLGEKLMTGFGRTHRRLPLSSLMRRPASQIPQWARTSLEAARLAPSAVNRQPWGFDVGAADITVFVRTPGPEFNVSKRLDCGIAMLHLELAALTFGVRGRWDLLGAPDVARFLPAAGDVSP